MLSYNEWEKLNENFDFTLGLVSPPSLGVIGSLGVDLEGNDIVEKKMNKCKKMHGEEEEDAGDELVKAAAPKDKDVDVDDDDNDDDDSDDSDDSETDDSESDDSDCDDDSCGGDKKPPFMSKKGSKKKSKKKSSKRMKKEETEEDVDAKFWASIKSQMGGNSVPNKNWDGMPIEWDGSPIEEEALIAPPKVETETSEPGPGEPGFAPATRIGFGSVPSFEEWKTLNFGSDE